MYFYNNKKKKYRYYEQKEKNKLDFSAVDRDLEKLKFKEKEYEKEKIKKSIESDIEEFGFALDYNSSNFYSPYYRPYNYNGGGYTELDWQERAENYASDQLTPMQEIIYEYGGSKLLEELYKRFKHLNIHFINNVVEAIDEAIEKNELFILDNEDINERLFYYAITLFASSTNMVRYTESSEIDIKSFAKQGLYDFNLVDSNEVVSKIMGNVYKEKEKRKREKEEERKRKEEAKRQYLANRKIKTLFGYKYTEKEFQNMMEIIRKKRAEGLNYSEIIYLGIMKLK